MGCGPSSWPAFSRGPGTVTEDALASLLLPTDLLLLVPQRPPNRRRAFLPAEVKGQVSLPTPTPDLKVARSKGGRWFFTCGTGLATGPLRTHPPCLWARSSPATPSSGSQPRRPAPGAGEQSRGPAELAAPTLGPGRSDSCPGS